MGNSRSSDHLSPPYLNCSRDIFLTLESHGEWLESGGSTYHTFLLSIRYQRYQWKISKRFQDILQLDEELFRLFPEKLNLMKVPRKYSKLFWDHNNNLLQQRGNDITNYLQRILDDQELLHSRPTKDFLGIGEVIYYFLP